MRAHLDNLSVVKGAGQATKMVASQPAPAARDLSQAHELRLHAHPLAAQIPALRRTVRTAIEQTYGGTSGDEGWVALPGGLLTVDEEVAGAAQVLPKAVGSIPATGVIDGQAR